MIELLEQDLVTPDRHSSKGNQLKWKNGNIWYKADFTGYEGLAEQTVSELLMQSTLDSSEFVTYTAEEIRYHNTVFLGVKSNDLLTDDWQIITLERLFHNHFGVSLYESIWKIRGTKERISFLCEQVERITGLKNFGQYLAKLFTLDAFFLNEDRHTHNIAVLMNGQGNYKLCPIFDNGGALLSDTTIDYPLSGNVYSLIDTVKAKTVNSNFREQLLAAEELYGLCLHFRFTTKDIDRIVNAIPYYKEEEKERVKTILHEQRKVYSYLFKN